MIPVKPKKSLGQHFLTDKNIARKIVNSLTWEHYDSALEVGPGMGVLSEFLAELPGKTIKYIEIDSASVEYLKNRFPGIENDIIASDVLRLPLNDIFPQPFAIIGNFPYNISSQLFFKTLEYKNQVTEVVCMVQKEVASRIATPPGSKEYGILSVLLQAYYNIELLFTVPPQVFNPPPKVQSAVLRLRRNKTEHLSCDEAMFFRVVKTAFNQRRKTLRNSLKSLLLQPGPGDDLLQKRPEQLGVEAFVRLTNMITEGTSMNQTICITQTSEPLIFK
jgi:16S rRNA (adenine1518-N6/adenine1519-N6)-dimethyltransferase